MTVNLEGVEALLADRPIVTIQSSVVRDLIAELRQERERADKAEKLLDMVSGVAASSIPDTSLRGKPMAAVVDLAAKLYSLEGTVKAVRAIPSAEIGPDSSEDEVAQGEGWNDALREVERILTTYTKGESHEQ